MSKTEFLLKKEKKKKKPLETKTIWDFKINILGFILKG